MGGPLIWFFDMPPLKGLTLAFSSPATLQSYLVLPQLSSPSLPLLPPPLPLHSGGPSIWFFDMPPLKYRGLLARCFLPSPCSDMHQSPRTGSELAPLNPSNHLCCRTCSHYSPGLFSGLREGRPPSVHQYCQNRGRCLPSGSSSNVNGLPYQAQTVPHSKTGTRALLGPCAPAFRRCALRRRRRSRRRCCCTLSAACTRSALVRS